MQGAEVTVTNTSHGGTATYNCLDGFKFSSGVTNITVQCELDTDNMATDSWAEPTEICLGNQVLLILLKS